MVLLAAWFGWRVSRYAGPVAGCLVAVGLLSFAVPIMRTCLIVTDEGLVDRRTVRTVRVPWQQIAEFRVAQNMARTSGGYGIRIREDAPAASVPSPRSRPAGPSRARKLQLRLPASHSLSTTSPAHALLALSMTARSSRSGCALRSRYH